jgi:hypothetical protein
MATAFTRFLDHKQRRATVGRTSLDEWSARRRDLYLRTHNRRTSIPPVRFEPTTLVCVPRRNYYRNSVYQLSLHFAEQCICVMRMSEWVSESRNSINQLVCNGDAVLKRLMTRMRWPYKRFWKLFV